MSLLFLEGFGGMETKTHAVDGAGLRPNWSSMSNTVTVNSFVSGTQGIKKSLSSPNSSFNLWTRAWARQTTIVVGMRVFWDGGDWVIGCFQDGRWRAEYFGIQTTGQLAYHWHSGYFNESTHHSTLACVQNQWSYVEFEMTFGNGTAGSAYFYINGNLAGSALNVDTIYDGSFAGCNGVAFGTGTWTTGKKITDIYVDSDTVRGPMDIWYQPCDTAGSTSGFTPSAGNNEDNVDDDGLDGDSTYNESSSPTTKDQLAHSHSLDSDPIAIQPMAWARTYGNGSGGLKLGVLSDTTEDLSDARGVGEDYTGVVGDIYEDDPDTTSPWVAADADAAETVYEHASVI